MNIILKLLRKMKITLFYGYLLIIILASCSSSKYFPKFYSKNELSFEQLLTLYENVPYFQDSTIYIFITHLEVPTLLKEAKELGIVGTVVCHPLIDEYGEVEAVYLKQPLHPIADEAAIEAIKLSEYRTFKSVMGKDSKYSLMIPMEFFVVYEKELDYFFKNESKKRVD